MAAYKLLGSSEWTSDERKFAAQFTAIEREELAFPAVHHLEWLNEHIHEVLSERKANLHKALKTPGKLKGRTPGTIRPALNTNFVLAAGLANVSDDTESKKAIKQCLVEFMKNELASNTLPLSAEPVPQVIESKSQEIVGNDTPESESSSPGPSNIPQLESTSFAPLPPRETLAAHLADEEEDWIAEASGPTSVINNKSTTIASQKPEIALISEESPHIEENDHDSEDNDEFNIDLRAPELIAHEKRMQQYASPDFTHNKAASTITLASPAKLAMERPPSPAKSISVSVPVTTTTPHTSPRRFMDAAKNKVHSALSSAKRLMAKSAGISAAAKMEAKADYPDSPTPKPPKISNDMPGMYPSLENLDDKPLPATPIPEPRRTRSSAQREELEEHTKEKDVTTQEKEEELDKTADKENERAEEPYSIQSKPQAFSKSMNGRDEPTRVRSRTTQKPLGKPVRPTAAAAKPKPQPVSIKINALSSRMPVNTAPVAAHNQEAARGDIPRPELKRKASNQSLASTTTAAIRNNTTQATSRVMQLAAKKKQQDELAAQKDAERKRRMKQLHNETRGELVRTTREEEEEKERKARENSAEKQKKHLADIDNREIKRQKSEERQEREEAAAAAKKAAFRAQQQKRGLRPPPPAQPPQPPPRQPERPPARNGFHVDSDDEDQEDTPTNSPRIRPRVPEPRESAQSQLPRLGAGLYQSAIGKQKEQPEPELPPTYQGNLFKAAPLRSSNLGKKPSIFQTTSQPAPPTVNQFPQPPRNIPQMQQYAHQRIPFATQMPNAGPNNTGPANRPVMNQQVQQTIQTIQAVHTSPATDITLPEIHTDSSSDEETRFQVPSWATPGHLIDSLTQQDAVVDPDMLFPAIQPIDMDSVFPNNRSRAHKMHVRTSSANWTRSGDGLTREEIDRDRAARQTIRTRGGWAYGH